MTRFLALGDSYTLGEAVDTTQSWPILLVELLRREGFALADPTILARTGWTTDELGAGIDAAGLKADFSLVTLLIGVNNQYRGRSLEEYEEQFCDLMHRAIGFARGESSSVIVLSIPDWGVMPFASDRHRSEIGTAIDRFNAINRSQAITAGTRYVDVTFISREAAINQSLVGRDGLHPSPEMYNRWARLIAPIARDILSKSSRKAGKTPAHPRSRWRG